MTTSSKPGRITRATSAAQPLMKRWQMGAIGRLNLSLATVPVPQPQAGEVLVEVGAVSLNNRDKHVIDSGMGLPLPVPFVPASDLAGVVMALGAGVTRFRVGDRVISTFVPGWIDGRPLGTARTPQPSLGGVYQGVLAEYVALSEEWLVAAPSSLNDEAASTLPCAGLTAWNALVELGAVQSGQTALVHGTGGVSLFGIQIAKARGARVIVVSASAEKRSRAQALGADDCVDRNENWVETILRITAGGGADHILETVGGANLGRSLLTLAPGGRVSFIGVQEGFELSASAGQVLPKQATIQGISVGHRRALEDFVRAIDRVALKPVIDRSYAMDELPQALAHLDRGPFGKVVIKVR